MPCINKNKNKRITKEEYFDSFDISKRELALEHALDIRKFEIDMYWKRATYFWTFIGATLAGYAALQLSTKAINTGLTITLSCLGLVFSVGWACVNKGSKQWQENWENHVDKLEDDIIGPLYKTVLKRGQAKDTATRLNNWLTGPASFSVTKINQVISYYVVVLWCFLIYKSYPWLETYKSIEAVTKHKEPLLIFVTTVIVCFGIPFVCRTSTGEMYHNAYKRESKIIDPK